MSNQCKKNVFETDGPTFHKFLRESVSQLALTCFDRIGEKPSLYFYLIPMI